MYITLCILQSLIKLKTNITDISRKKLVKYKDINITCIHYGEHNNTKTQGLRQRASEDWL
jgi:hypothetical protein